MICNLTYGEALEAAKNGHRIARDGWNGKNMFVFMRPGDSLPIDFVRHDIKSLPQSVKDYFKNWGSGDTIYASGKPIMVEFLPYLCMKAVNGEIVNGWLASQTDMLTNDWCILDD